MDQTTKEFAISPPYFDYSTLEGEEKIARKKMVKDFIDSRIGFKRVQSQTVLEHSLAGALHHDTWNSNLKCPKDLYLTDALPTVAVALLCIKRDKLKTRNPSLTI